MELKIIDEIILEPTGGAHRNKQAILNNVKLSIKKNLEYYESFSRDEIYSMRKEKFLAMGRENGFKINEKGENTLLSTQPSKINLISFLKQKKNYVIFIVISLLISLFLIL